jgi:protein arginine kinase activator
MKCDLCDKSAVVHEVTVKHGVKNEVHLCEEHAKAHGMVIPSAEPVLEQVLTQYVITKRSSDRASRLKCGTCDLSLAEFRQNGVLGCPDCYDALEKPLGAMIERAQNGGITHVGKSPKRSGSTIDRRLRMQSLMKELECAVASEQYERAAALRDRLRDMETAGPDGDEPVTS